MSLHYDNLTFSYSDLALLRLQETLDFQDGVMPICLPQAKTIWKKNNDNKQINQIEKSNGEEYDMFLLALQVL